MKVFKGYIYIIAMCLTILSVLTYAYRFFHVKYRPVFMIVVNVMTPFFVLIYLLISYLEYKKNQKQ